MFECSLVFWCFFSLSILFLQVFLQPGSLFYSGRSSSPNAFFSLKFYFSLRFCLFENLSSKKIFKLFRSEAKPMSIKIFESCQKAWMPLKRLALSRTCDVFLLSIISGKTKRTCHDGEINEGKEMSCAICAHQWDGVMKTLSSPIPPLRHMQSRASRHVLSQ